MDDFAQTTMLVRSAQGGDRQALDSLFARYLPRVRRIVAARMGRSLREMTAEDDIVQESLLDAFRAITAHGLTSEGAFRHWLARCVENNVRDGRRRADVVGRVRLLEPREGATDGPVAMAAAGPTPSEHAAAHELDPRLERALLALRDEHREVVVLRLLCEMSFAEIATTMGHPNEATARSWFARAMRKLRAGLAT